MKMRCLEPRKKGSGNGSGAEVAVESSLMQGNIGQDVIASLCTFWPIGFVIMVGNMSYKWIFEIQLLVLACTLQMNNLDYIAWKGAQACRKTENEMAWQPLYLKIPNICSHAGDNDARLVLSST